MIIITPVGTLDRAPSETNPATFNAGAYRAVLFDEDDAVASPVYTVTIDNDGRLVCPDGGIPTPLRPTGERAASHDGWPLYALAHQPYLIALTPKLEPSGNEGDACLSL